MIFNVSIVFVLLLIIYLEFHRIKAVYPEDKILGGYDWSIESAPYYIQIIERGNFHCGGSIIRRQVVLTAAHCVDGSDPEVLQIYAGSDQVEEGTKYRVKKFLKHDRYKQISPNSFDVALIFLQTQFEYSDTVQPIYLYPPNLDLPVDHEVLIIGQGQIDWDGHKPTCLQGIELPVVDDKKCKKFVDSYQSRGIKWDESQICIGDLERANKDACLGDSGGPVTVGVYQVAITSWGIGCGNLGYPGVYTRISYVKSWIDDNIKNYPD